VFYGPGIVEREGQPKRGAGVNAAANRISLLGKVVDVIADDDVDERL
jgi:hypothetical protein